MRLIAIHDAEGTISTLLTIPPKSPLLTVEIKGDQLKTELEASETKLDLKDPQRLAEVVENFRVECKVAVGKLLKKADPKKNKQ